MPEGRVELWYHDQGAQMERGWRFRVTAGQTVELVRPYTTDRQQAADEATLMWPNVVRKEQARVSKVEASRRLEAQIEDACRSGRVDVMAFGLGSSTYDRLLEINAMLVRRHWLDGTMKALREAVSAELYRRRQDR
jgi:hypothetical protein